ncbi:hypothetical protein [Burkholderia gladioli]|uniref:hypothetical protein n=1 Tax=Burkholderia gladioli TaxID=28095 RepID=UPI00163F0412|nr:hypothetical protein [Burkholderia gladioli]
MKISTILVATFPLVVFSLSHAQVSPPGAQTQPRNAREILEQAKRDYGTPGLRRVFDFSGEGIPIKNPTAARSLNRKDLNAMSSLLDAVNEARQIETSAPKTCGIYALCRHFQDDDNQRRSGPLGQANRSASIASTSVGDDDKKKQEDREKQKKADQERAEQLKREIDANFLSRTRTSDGETMGKKLKDNIDELNSIP